MPYAETMSLTKKNPHGADRSLDRKLELRFAAALERLISLKIVVLPERDFAVTARALLDSAGRRRRRAS